MEIEVKGHLDGWSDKINNSELLWITETIKKRTQGAINDDDWKQFLKLIEEF